MMNPTRPDAGLDELLDLVREIDDVPFRPRRAEHALQVFGKIVHRQLVRRLEASVILAVFLYGVVVQVLESEEEQERRGAEVWRRSSAGTGD